MRNERLTAQVKVQLLPSLTLSSRGDVNEAAVVFPLFVPFLFSLGEETRSCKKTALRANASSMVASQDCNRIDCRKELVNLTVILKKFKIAGKTTKNSFTALRENFPKLI